MRAIIIPTLLLTLLIWAIPGCGRGEANKSADTSGGFVRAEPLDRVCVEEVLLHPGPDYDMAETGPRMPAWTFAHYVRTENGFTLLRFPDGAEWWARPGDFLPVYHVNAPEPDVYDVYFTDGSDFKAGEKPDGLKVIDSLAPGEYVAVFFEAQAPLKMVLVESAFGVTGFVELDALTPVGDPGRVLNGD